MRKIIFKVLLIASAVLFIVACTNTKNKESRERVYRANGDAVYPSIEGMVPHAVSVTDKGEDEANLKVQLKVGKIMEVDCNQHRLEGQFEEMTLDGYGYSYYTFDTNGNVASTMMACPDNTKTEKFVSGEDHFISYNSKLTIPVYTPEDYEVRYTTWSVKNEYNAMQNFDKSINPDVEKQVKSYPESIEGYDRYVMYLPPQENEEELRLEIIPGVIHEVDCNTHWLMGEFETKVVEGMGYEYLVFNSNGDIVSTRMACPDNEVTEELVAAEGHFGRYNSKVSVIVFVPEGLKLKLRTWKANHTRIANKM